MQKRNGAKKITGMIFFLSLAISSIFYGIYFTINVFANGAGHGATVAGGECRTWSTCERHGLAWGAYYLTQKLPDNGVYVGYSDNVPKVVISGCDAGQTLYNYGFIAQNDNNAIDLGNGNFDYRYNRSYNKQVGTIERGKYPKSKYIIEDDDVFLGTYEWTPNRPTLNTQYYGKTYYPDEDYEVKQRYNMMKNYCKSNEHQAESVCKNLPDWDHLGWFCFDPNAIYYNTSSVKVQDKTNPSNTTSTIINKAQKTKRQEVSAKDIEVGNEVDITFFHDIFVSLVSIRDEEKFTWTVTNNFTTNNIDYKTTTGNQNGTYKSNTCNKTTLSKVTDDYHVCHDTNQNQVDANYMVVFNKAGTYSFCQTLKVAKKDTPTKIMNETTVCANIEVKEKKIQEVLTSKTIAKGESADQSVDSSKNPDAILTVQTNQDFTMTFESELLTNKQGKKVDWHFALRKNFNNANINYKSWTNEVVSSNIKLSGTPKNLSYNGYSVTLDKIRPNLVYFVSDKSKPLLKNTVKMSIKATGEYLFCQKIIPEGGESSEGCVKVKVIEAPCNDCSCKFCPPDTPPPPPGGCSSHTPGSWDSSNEKSGTTSTWSGVASNVFTNIDNQTSIWAKPGDVITFKHCYFPGAQTVRKTTPGTDSEPKSYPEERDPLESETTLSSPAITKYPSTYSYIPKPTVVVESSNNFSISTDYPSLFSTGISYSLSGSGFSGSGPSFSGTVGKKDGAQVIANNSAGLKVAPNAVGKTITQSIGSNVGTTSVTGHSSWTWNYSWNWQYTCIKCALDQQKVNSCIADKTTACDGSTKGNCNPTKIRNACTSDDANKVDVKKTAYGYGYGSGTHYYNDDGTVGTFYTPSSYTSYNGSSTSASVRIPYNYKTEVQEPEFSNDKIYAGQTFGVGTVETDVLKRINSTLQGEYATKTPETTIKLYSFYSNSLRGGGNEQAYSGNRGDCSYYNGYGYTACNELSSYTTTLNNGYDVNGSIESISHFASSSYAIPDIPAGYYFCVAASAWPAESANDTDMGLTGNSKAYYSKPFCKTVNKKPIFEVWGGNLYVAGGVKASYALKNNLSGSTEFTYQPNIFSSNIAFPSWAEYSVVAGKNINTLASGSAAAGGKRVGNSNTPCKFSPLTMSNSDCKNGSTSATLGNYSGKTQPKTVSETAQGIRKLFVDSGEVKTGAKFGSNASIDLSAASSYIQNASGTRYTYVDGNAYLTASRELEPNITHVIYVTGDVIINSNITYTQGGYTDISQVPQYIIISDRNLYIAGHVSTLHAQLIFDKGTIYTCASGTTRITDPANPVCSNQLRTIGTIVAQKLKLDRTYGAATGERSSWPAEILDAGLTTMLWSGSSESEAPTLHTVYTKEVSPRF